MSLQPVKTRAQAGDDRNQQADRFAGPWFNSKTAAAYIPCASVKAFYMWRRRHGIIPRNNGSVAKADLDRVLKARKPRRVMSAASLANLHKRHRVAVGSASAMTKNVNAGER